MTPHPPPAGQELTFLEALLVLGRRRRAVLGGAAAGLVLGLLLSFLTPATFTGTARILPPQQSQSAATAMLAQLGGAAAGFAGGALGLKTPNDLYIGMMKSDSVADDLIERFALRKAYGRELLVDARKDLAADSIFTSEKSGIIVIRVDARDARLAADLANAYVEALQRMTSTLAVTEAAQRRLFFEQQLQLAKEKLTDAEAALRTAIDRGGIVSVDAQSRATLETVGRLRAQISAKEIQLEAMRAYATAENPDRLRVEQELTSMRRELERLESGVSASDRSGAESASRGLDSVKLLRDVKYQEVMFELLAKQYELARVDEAKQAPLVQVVDRASPPERRSKPRRGLLTLGALFAGLVAGIAAAFVAEWWAKAQRDPEQAAVLAELRSSWARGPRT